MLCRVYACLFQCAQVTVCVTRLRSLYIWICACWFWHSAYIVRDTVPLPYSSLTSDTKVTFDAFFVRFDVFSLVFYTLVCVLYLLIVLYSVLCCCTAYSLLSCACTSILFFGLAYLSLAGVFVVFSVVVFCSFESELI